MTREDVGEIVREMEDEYTAAFGRKDAKALAALLTEDVTLVTEWGDVVQGRAEIERMLVGVFPGMPDKLEIESTTAHARAIAGDVIVSHGTLHKIGAWGAGEDRLSYTRVLVRLGGKWRISAIQVAPASSMPDPRASQTHTAAGTSP
jgi:uncharacterized protein (TIGR02246 family)